MDIEDINPAAVIGGIVGGAIGYFMAGRMEELQLIWRILTPLFCALGGFFIVHKMSSD